MNIMERTNLPSGDGSSTEFISGNQDISTTIDQSIPSITPEDKNWINDELNTKKIEDNEVKLKERIEQCKNVIISLKFELNEEKLKLERETKYNQSQQIKTPSTYYCPDEINNDEPESLSLSSNIYASVDSKFTCDENLLEYEKQLQRYQNTLNMAQIEKKNAIRKQMLAKAFKLKLLEVENQCNIELLRIKQNLQCLEPLQMIVEKWKTMPNADAYDLNNFELMPRYPELNLSSDSDATSNFNNGDA